MSKVVVLKTEPETVLEDYAKLLKKANFTKEILKKYETVLKINLSWSMYYPACSTEPWQLEAIVKYMLDEEYKNIHPVENRTVVTDVWKGAKGNRWLPVLRKYKQKYEPLTEVKWINYKPKAEMLAMDKIFPDGHKIPEMFIGKNVVHLPTMKTHGHTTMTGAMKNAFGGLITARRHHSHKMIHEVLVDLLQIQKEIHKGIFAVMDGTVCGDGKGPRTMYPKIKDYIVASKDQVAIDAISAKMMGFDPMKIKFIKIAHDLGLGMGDVDQIDIVGENISKVNFKFKTGKSAVIMGDQLMRNHSKAIEKILFHTPLFKMCILGSETYHDRFWYPVVGKPRIRKFMKSKWGRLFRTYES
ncbi:DUF362 domain-containing protein [archaeon]|jgi:uncharacterized protein (DUF362 family)|nr:DUF362 domain-containing protein [archaeon]MBT4397043.1 DUF362 domain-containing protein [archaeon]MBT4441034.1 DUF362 domain-containing protein [archaeon]